MNNKKYDIFISYRRRDAGDKAEHLKDLLEPYYRKRISFDRENLSGKFNVQLIERIDNIKDFLLVIGSHSLVYNENDRSEQVVSFYRELTSMSQADFAKKIESFGPDADIDYVRIEIGRALRRKDIHIIPVVPERTNEFNFATLNLPPDIAEVKSYEAVFYSNSPDALFKDVVPKVRQHLRSKADIAVNKKLLIAILMAMMVILCGISFYAINAIKAKRTEESRINRMHQLEERYSSCGLNFYENDTISIEQMNAIDDILQNMQDIKSGILQMGMFEVTVSQWNGIMKTPYEKNDSLLPKTNVTLGECVNFTFRLSELTNIYFDIPSEEEWVFAARGGELPDSTVYSGSNDPSKVAWYKSNSENRLHKCDGALEANNANLFNMSGNAAEWCNSQFYEEIEKQENLKFKVVCGGDYLSSSDNITVDSRRPVDENERNEAIGLRLVLRMQ